MINEMRRTDIKMSISCSSKAFFGFAGVLLIWLTESCWVVTSGTT
jgi:hypothetical protein